MSGTDWASLAVIGIIGLPWMANQLKEVFQREQVEEITDDTCRCGHASVFHDTGGCRKIVTAAVRWDGAGDESKWEQRECECLRYAGSHSSYVPELDGLPQPQENSDAQPALERPRESRRA